MHTANQLTPTPSTPNKKEALMQRLSYALIGETSRSYDFGEEKYDYDQVGEGWHVAHFDCPRRVWATEAQWAEAVTLSCGTKIVAPYDEDNLEISIEFADEDLCDLAKSWLEPTACEPGDSDDVEPDHQIYDELCKALGLEAPPEAVDEEDRDAWHPMINRLYPLAQEWGEGWTEKMHNMTVVVVEGDYYLALTGGGMDMTWAIVATYVDLGYLPPADLCDLPGMAGRGESESDLILIEACKRSCQARINQLERTVERLAYLDKTAS